MKLRTVVLLVFLMICTSIGYGERIKDIVDIQGVRGNPLSGVGLVVGLTGTGDTSLPSRQVLTNILRSSGQVLDVRDVTGGNIALVMVTASLGPFSREGSRIDVDVSSIGDAKSLQGGLLLPTPLLGLDDEVYAVTQASGISLGGFGASGKQGSISKNHQTVGRIPDGAIVERAEIADFIENIAGERYLTLNLRNIDFSTSERIKQAINTSYPGSAIVLDAGTIKIKVPHEISMSENILFIDNITSLDVKVDMPAIVVINERTGTIVVGENVGISAVAISQGSLVIKVRETATVSQPTTPFTNRATTEVVPETLISMEEADGYLIPMPEMVTVSELAKALNSLGASPTDMIAIFNALKKAGALQAKLEIM